MTDTPVLNTDRELWNSDGEYYSDRVFATSGGGIGMHPAFGRAIVKTVGAWHYLVTEVEQLRAGYKAFPTDVALVMRDMRDGESVYSAATISSETGVPEKRVKEIQRALKVLGLASFGPLCDGDADAYIAKGSGYWLSPKGGTLDTALHAASVGRNPEGGDAQQGSVEDEHAVTPKAADAQTGAP